MSIQRFHLVVACPDQVGLVADVSAVLAQFGLTIVEADHHTDQTTGWFFMRNEVSPSQADFDEAAFTAAFTEMAQRFSMQWHWQNVCQAKRVVLLASKQSHCLVDLLHRWHTGDLFCDVVAIVSNHDIYADLAASYGVPFHHVAIDPANKAAGFSQMQQLIDSLHIDVMVLARYMQILPPELCARYAKRIINIHHSSLPSFAGAKPYHQAYERGVKLIGATCHYVTADLDEGPIIAQDVVHVNHRQGAEDLVRLGKDVERVVLARGLKAHLEDRVLVQGNKTVVL